MKTLLFSVWLLGVASGMLGLFVASLVREARQEQAVTLERESCALRQAKLDAFVEGRRAGRYQGTGPGCWLSSPYSGSSPLYLEWKRGFNEGVIEEAKSRK